MFTKLVLTVTVVLLANTCNNRQAATEKNKQDTAATVQADATQPDPWAFIQKKRWNLIQMNGDTVAAFPTSMWLEFDTADHRFTGHGGCNRLSGNYEADNQQIQFKQVISTRMACLNDSANERESTFLRLLNDHRYTFDIAEQTLNLYDSGKVVLMFGMQDKPVEPAQ